MITADEFKKKMKTAWKADDYVEEGVLVIESTIEEILKEMNK